MDNVLMHHGIQGMKWGVRNYQTKSGKLTPEGRLRYSKKNTKLSDQQKADEQRLLKSYVRRDNAKASRDNLKKEYRNVASKYKKASDELQNAKDVAKKARQDYDDYKATKNTDPKYSRRKAFSLWEEAHSRKTDVNALLDTFAEIEYDKDLTKSSWKSTSQNYNTANKDIGLQAKEYTKKYGQVAYKDFERVRETLYE